MIKKILVFLVLVLNTFCVGNAMYRGRNCMANTVSGNGKIVSYVNKIDGRDYLLKIDDLSFISSRGVQIKSTYDDSYQISLTTDENIANTVDIRINEENYVIEYSSKERISPTIFLIEIAVPLRGFIGYGSFDFDIFSGVEKFSLNVKGESNGKVKLNCVDSANICLNGKSNLSLSGHSNSFCMDVSGNVNIDAVNVVSKICNVLCAGCGSVKVFSSDLLSLNMRGNWKCGYSGNPKKINKSIEGLCKIQKIV